MTDPTWTLQISSIELFELPSGFLIWFSITYILQILNSFAKQGRNRGIFSLMFFSEQAFVDCCSQLLTIVVGEISRIANTDISCGLFL